MTESASAKLVEAKRVYPLFDGARLRLAREARAWTQKELARQIGEVTPAAISQFESGDSKPSAQTLTRVAEALRFPISFFGVTPQSQTESPGAFFRSLRSTPVASRNRSHALAELVWQFVNALENRVRLPSATVPEHPIPMKADRTRVEKIAAKVRREWKVPAGPIDDVVQLLERNGVVCVRFKIETTDVDAFSVPFERRPIVVLGSDKQACDRGRFNAAHELGHLVMHKPSVDNISTLETQAHWFAAEFLMPADEIADDLPSRVDWPRLLALKGKWRVSIAALLIRAKALGKIGDGEYVSAMKYMSMHGWRKEEPGNLGPAESPTLLARAIQAANSAGCSLQGLVREAALPQSLVDQFLGASTDPRPIVEI
jgi:Zn-dependent peptidase ImmA (M78 family)/transcriptional regulator with XRE-family HTH domain